VKHILTFILACFFCLNAQSQSKRTYFAVGLFAGSHSSLITYAILTVRDSVIIGAQVVSEQQFMYQAMGYYPSIANINKVNLFEKYQVDSCFLLYNDMNKVAGYYAKPFADLWKIRFYENPVVFDSRGWSQGQYKPSLYQMKILYEQYGVDNVLVDYFYGDSLFKLLRDVQDPAWVEAYRFAVKDTTGTGDSTTTQNNTGQP